MTRDAGRTGEVISVDANDENAYTVTITEDNLMLDEELAENEPEVVTAEEAGVPVESAADVEVEMTRDEVELEDGAGVEAESGEKTEEPARDQAPAEEAGDGQTADEAGETGEATADEQEPADAEAADVQAEPEVVAETAEVVATEAEGTANEESGEWSLAKVKQEDVKVCFNVAVQVSENQDAEPVFETHEAEVTAFSNDNGTIELTFRGEASGDGGSSTYTVCFAGSEAYAVVLVTPAPSDVVIEDVDYDAQIAELGAYAPDFTDEDISLPKGTYLDDGELVVTEDATEVVQDVLVDSGFAEGEMSRADNDATPGGDGGAGEGGVEAIEFQDADAPAAGNADAGNAGGNGDTAAVQYMQQYNATQKAYQNYDALASYAPEVLGYINPTAGKVGEMGADAYYIFKGIYTNNWGSAIQGTMGVLKMFGLFKGGPTGVSNEQILSEVQKVGLEVADMHELTKAMNSTLNETLRQAYRNNLQTFDNAVVSLHANAEIVQSMFVEGAIRAAEDGIEPPAEDCDAEDEYEYNYNLIEYIEGLEKKGGRKNSAFKGFTEHMNNLKNDFVLVAGEVAKPGDSNPVKAYDKYWDLHFNFESQGYYLRQSYRSNIEYELKRGFGLMEIYYNIFDPYTKGNYLEYNTELFAALDRLEEFNAGVSPEDVIAHTKNGEGFTGLSMYCPTLKRTIRSATIPDWGRKTGATVATGLLEEYLNRLHGRDILGDLRLAGLVHDGCWYWNDGNWVEWHGSTSYGIYQSCAHGIGFNGKMKDDWYVADIIGWDGKLHKGVKVCYKDMWKKTLDPFDAPGAGNIYAIPYIYFDLA